MKVAFVLPSIQNLSGWRTHSVELIHTLVTISPAADRLHPVIFVPAAEMSAAKDIFPSFPIYALPVTQGVSLNNLAGFRSLLQCNRYIRTNDFPGVDIIHSLEAYPTGLVGSWLADKLGCPHAITAHGTYGVVWFDSFPDRLLYSQVLRKASLVCPVSHGTASMMEQYFGGSLCRTTVRPILNGNSFVQNVSRNLAFSRRMPEIPTLLTVGGVKQRKGLHISLQAFVLLKERFPKARYWIVGAYQENEYYNSLLRILPDSIRPDVQFLGVVSSETLAECYAQASLFVMTPQSGLGRDRLHFEGFGLVYLEAGAYGLPVVGSRSGGVPDAVREGITGFLADPLDVQGFAQSIQALLEDEDRWSSMGQANRNWAETLTWERCAGEYLQVYSELVSSKAGL